MGGTAVLIPARGSSRGIPRKNLVDLCGRPLLVWALLQAEAANVGPIGLTTDDDEIACVAHEALPSVAILREPKRDGTTTMEKVIRGAISFAREAEWLVLLQSTSPLRLAGHIAEAVTVAVNCKADSVVSVTETHKFHWHWDGSAELTPILHDKNLRSMRQDVSPWLTEGGSIYVMRVSKFLEENTRFCGRTVPYVMPPWTAHEIDTPEDLDMVRLILADRLRQGKDGIRT